VAASGEQRQYIESFSAMPMPMPTPMLRAALKLYLAFQNYYKNTFAVATVDIWWLHKIRHEAATPSSNYILST